ncbi:TonB-dependent siderophore receptor [Marinobacter xestospongiae]|uniref:TonB-dependent siderophore receptor n=1 Tax=Marinobacter xestospongiae TaxID=994319 RepID=UPI0020045834|nr:TonB-dependent siderophore receptor [Marinobacter xestospongiae]MCK7567291.1 TonB-dependent siderophore receptor [Marinobacter xestospongiae]
MLIRKTKCSMMLWGLATILPAATLSPVAVAQGSSTSASQRVEQTVRFAIAPGPLDAALKQFRAQAGVAVSLPADAAEVHSQGLNGGYTAAAGLARLLAGTGLQALASANGGYSVIPAAHHALAPVEVSATALAMATEHTRSYTLIGESDTATGLGLTLRETPQSVTVITRQQMDDQNVRTINDALEQTVGILRSQHGDAETGYITYYSRGFGINNYQFDGINTSALGGFRGRGGASGRDMAVYDQMTVVRGATGLLSGAGDPSATINLVRKRPTREFQGHASVKAGRWDRYRGEVDVSGPLAGDGSVRARVVAAHTDNQSWMERASSEKSTLYGVIEADLSAETVVRGGIEHFRMRNRQTSMHGFPYADTDGNRTHLSGFDNPYTRSSYLDMDHSTFFANLDHRFHNGWEARLAATHTRIDGDQLYGVAAHDIQAEDNSSGVTFGKSIDKPTQNTLDGSLSGYYTLFGREHELAAGFNWARLEKDDPGFRRHVVPVDNIYEFDGSTQHLPFESSGRSTSNIRQSGGYVTTRLRPVDELAIILGGRVSKYRNVESDLDESGQFTPYLGLVYEFVPNWSAYASYTTIFNPQSNEDEDGTTLDPEQGKNYEVGVKTELMNGRLNATAAVFHTLKDNLAVADGDKLTPDGGQAYVAASDTKTNGWELEVSGELTPGWQLAGGFTHVITRDGDDNRLNTSVVPENQFKLSTSYDFSQTLQGLTLGGGVIWQSKVWENGSYYSDAQKALYREDSRAVVDLMARYRMHPQLSLALNLENALDKRYRTQVSQHNIGAPRNLTATVRYSF